MMTFEVVTNPDTDKPVILWTVDNGEKQGGGYAATLRDALNDAYIFNGE